MERNLCVEGGCQAACCRNQTGYMAPWFFGDFIKAFPGATEVVSESELVGKIKKQQDGVYYFNDKDGVHFSISGDCPNLNGNLMCGIYRKPYYPEMCRRKEFGSLNCEDSKQKYLANLVSLH